MSYLSRVKDRYVDEVEFVGLTRRATGSPALGANAYNMTRNDRIVLHHAPSERSRWSKLSTKVTPSPLSTTLMATSSRKNTSDRTTSPRIQEGDVIGFLDRMHSLSRKFDILPAPWLQTFALHNGNPFARLRKAELSPRLDS